MWSWLFKKIQQLGYGYGFEMLRAKVLYTLGQDNPLTERRLKAYAARKAGPIPPAEKATPRPRKGPAAGAAPADAAGQADLFR